ncbi:unnamed protein product [Allacma fusca]|uniref:Uncharacterized protein n=1 Tax=Allacma fusca TaxID=39272 RepID=A0A8J2NZ20_9HEXA|nr:unnamed protein product [Allacma fusca]
MDIFEASGTVYLLVEDCLQQRCQEALGRFLHSGIFNPHQIIALIEEDKRSGNGDNQGSDCRENALRDGISR